MTPAEIKVSLPGRGYSIWVGPGLLERASELIPVPEGAELVALVTDVNVRTLHGERASRGLAPLGLRASELALAPGEETKSLATVESAMHWLTRAGAHRYDMVAALGGGVVGDVAGFLAATYYRGIACVQLPTTLLAQVDAAIGGKTGVNLPEGKNLVGSFHQPIVVIDDTDVLRTLPKAEFASGLAEVAKHGLLGDAELLSMLEAQRDPLLARDSEALTGIVARAAAVKARVVEEDETERGPRAYLNYGHTLGHALEALGGYRAWRHGEAVAIGMMFAAHLAALLGYADRVPDHRRVLWALGLPTDRSGVDYDVVSRVWRADKKYQRGMRFVVLEDLGRPTVVSDVPEELLRKALEAVR
jgi:3-dehydroquinate synthase